MLVFLSQLSIVGFVPRPGSDRSLTSTPGMERSLLAVNGRPVHMKELLKVQTKEIAIVILHSSLTQPAVIEPKD